MRDLLRHGSLRGLFPNSPKLLINLDSKIYQTFIFDEKGSRNITADELIKMARFIRQESGFLLRIGCFTRTDTPVEKD